MKWSKIEKRIKELIHFDRYLNSKEKELYPAWREERERKRAERAEKQQETSYDMNTEDRGLPYFNGFSKVLLQTPFLKASHEDIIKYYESEEEKEKRT